MYGTFTSKLTDQPKTVVAGDPLWDTLDHTRVRFVRLIDSTSVEVADTYTGKPLPDYRHPTQVFAY